MSFKEGQRLSPSFHSFGTVTYYFLNPLPHIPDFLTTLRKRPLEGNVGKGENAGDQVSSLKEIHFSF